MSDLPIYLLHLRPKGRAVIRDFFNAHGGVYALLTNPPETRSGSFGMRMAATPQLRNGEYWELASEEPLHGRVRRLRVYADGTTIFRASGDGSFLCWPPDSQGNLVNPVVVADSIVSFCRLARALLTMMSVQPDAIELSVEIRNATSVMPPLRMYRGALRQKNDLYLLRETDVHSVSEANPKGSVVASAVDVSATTQDDPFVGSDATAYRVVGKFYEMFGFVDADLPYITRGATSPRVAIETFG